ncbi:hypothetical protein R1sor_011230 [Riccia sorocarpa]|uniref:Pyrrolo-quinoline quinone repeat domain-containing protein n=1 Tax=Riccia sorocarpa TaxID=122646 RepID=A0ABD3I3S0_9MARC
MKPQSSGFSAEIQMNPSSSKQRPLAMRFHGKSSWILILLSAATIVESFAKDEQPGNHHGDQWLNHGGDLTNDRWARFEKRISISTVQKLNEKWTFTADSDVTATPSISDGMVYFPDWSGSLYAIKQKTGELVWKKNLTALAAASLGSGNRTLVSRSAPTIAGNRLLVSIYGPCAVIAVSRSKGEFLWSKLLDPHPYGIATMSGTEYEGYFYVGSSSTEETATDACCSFQGSFFKLDVESGKIIWRVPMLPDNGGRNDQYAGNGLWGSSPPIDVQRRNVYIATGNNYQTPEDVVQCELNYQNLTNPPIPDPCIVPDNHVESVLAINLDSGNITWARHLGGYDTWVITCSLPNNGSEVNCPTIPGPDYDFGEAPILLTIPSNRSYHGRDILVIGQKSGIVWALDRETGDTVWETQAGPGGPSGGSIWGITTDGERVFTNIVNGLRKNFTLVPSTEVIDTGGWVGLNATSGQVLWSTASDLNPAPLTHANGVVFGGSTVGVVILDAQSGQILRSIPTNGSIYGGPSVSEGCSLQPVGLSPVAIAGGQFANITVRPGNSVVSLCAPTMG